MSEPAVTRKNDRRVNPVIEYLYRHGWRVVKIGRSTVYVVGGNYIHPADWVIEEWHDRPVP